jgi:hypothetical protein
MSKVYEQKIFYEFLLKTSSQRGDPVDFKVYLLNCKASTSLIRQGFED